MALRAHLDGCIGCRTEAARLEVTTSLLPLADVSRLDRREVPPDDLLRRIEAAVEVERTRGIRSSRARWIAAGAGVAAVLAIVLAVVLPSRGPDALDVSLRGATGVMASARAELTSKPWGTEILLGSEGLPSDTTYRVWLERSDGQRIPAGTFSGAGPELTMTLAASLPTDDAVAVGVSTEDGEDVLYGRIEA